MGSQVYADPCFTRQGKLELSAESPNPFETNLRLNIKLPGRQPRLLFWAHPSHASLQPASAEPLRFGWEVRSAQLWLVLGCQRTHVPYCITPNFCLASVQRSTLWSLPHSSNRNEWTRLSARGRTEELGLREKGRGGVGAIAVGACSAGAVRYPLGIGRQSFPEEDTGEGHSLPACSCSLAATFIPPVASLLCQKRRILGCRRSILFPVCSPPEQCRHMHPSQWLSEAEVTQFLCESPHFILSSQCKLLPLSGMASHFFPVLQGSYTNWFGNPLACRSPTLSFLELPWI